MSRKRKKHFTEVSITVEKPPVAKPAHPKREFFDLLGLFERAQCDTENRELFATCCRVAGEQLGVTPLGLARHFECGQVTARRWFDGTSVPSMRVRDSVLEYFISYLTGARP